MEDQVPGVPEKGHFLMMMSGAMDIFFFGTRIVLHRRNTAVRVIVKVFCLINMSLVAFDLMEVARTALSTQYKLKGQEERIAKIKKKGRQNKFERPPEALSEESRLELKLGLDREDGLNHNVDNSIKKKNSRRKKLPLNLIAPTNLESSRRFKKNNKNRAEKFGKKKSMKKRLVKESPNSKKRKN